MGHFEMASFVLRIGQRLNFVTGVFLVRISGQAIAHVMQRPTN
jgi:hypothetical protein